MFKMLLPRQENFFLLFQEVARELEATALQYQELLNDLSHQTKYIQAIEQHKNKAHALTRSTLESLHLTFITPFDRYDIYELTRGFLRTFDLLNRAALRILAYELSSAPKEVSLLGALCFRAATLVKSAVARLDALDHSNNILQLCNEIHQIESEADKILVTGVAQLFREFSDVKLLIINKEIYERTKTIIHQHQSLANIIECIVLEYS